MIFSISWMSFPWRLRMEVPSQMVPSKCPFLTPTKKQYSCRNIFHSKNSELWKLLGQHWSKKHENGKNNSLLSLFLGYFQENSIRFIDHEPERQICNWTERRTGKPSPFAMILSQIKRSVGGGNETKLPQNRCTLGFALWVICWMVSDWCKYRKLKKGMCEKRS